MRVLPSILRSRGSSGWPSGIASGSWASTLPSMPAGLRPPFCNSWKGSPSSISSATDSGPWLRKAMWPVRGSGSFMSTVKVPLRPRRRPSATANEASGALNSSDASSSRSRARGTSRTGQLSRILKARLAALQRQRGALGRRRGRPAGAAAACIRGQPERAALQPAAHQPLDDPVAGARRQRRRPKRLEDADRHRPDLAVEPRLHGARHVRHVAFGRNLGAAGAQLELAEHDAAALRRGKPARRPVVDRQPLQMRRLGAEPAARRLELEGPAGPVGALLRVDDAAGELHAAVAPHQHRGRDLEPARGAAVGQRQMAAVDLERRGRQPGQQYLPGRGVDADGAAQDLAGVGKVETGVAPHRHVEAFQARQRRQRARQAARHEALDGDGELQGVGGNLLVGAEVEGEGPGGGLDLGAAGDLAAAAPVVEIDAELGHAPDALAAALVDDDGGGLEPDLAQGRHWRARAAERARRSPTAP